MQRLLGTALPIIQAPMAGVQASALAIAVSNAGGLGSLPCAMLGPEAMRYELAKLKAVTANPFDASGLDPAFYVNVQRGGDFEVVAPPPGVQSDQLLYYFDQPNRPVVYLAHSSIIPAGEVVLSTRNLFDLGTALATIRTRLSAAYGPAAGNHGWYGLEVDFKFDASKSARRAYNAGIAPHTGPVDVPLHVKFKQSKVNAYVDKVERGIARAPRVFNRLARVAGRRRLVEVICQFGEV